MAGAKSEYLQYLPQILRGSEEATPGFLNGYLKVFEALFSGRDDTPITARVSSLDGIIDSFPSRLDPALAPVDAVPPGAPPRSVFLDYLARWVALSLDQNWELDKKREWLKRIVPLYKQRGTRAGISEYLAMFVGHQARVEELPGGFIVGSKPNATIGLNSFIAGAPAHFFRVRINYGFPPDLFSIDAWKNLRQGTRAIVDLEKPAHTYYTLHARTPGIIVGGAVYGGSKSPDPLARNKGRATIGKDTLVWQASTKV
jgi:phage tail-like protein